MKELEAMRSGRGRFLLALVFSVMGLTNAPDALAQNDQAQDATGSSHDLIIVTALKRETTLQDVPISVSVTSGKMIEQAQIRDIQDLSTLVPSLRVNTLQSSGNTNFYIRGFGNGANNAGIEPSVGLFIDNVYRSRSASMIADLPDVERVEVLRGPQSTLFGKNASAGVISIATRRPQFEPGGNVEASYGNFNAMVLKGVVTGPLGDTIAASIAGSLNRRDGYIRDLGIGGRANNRDRWTVRGQLLYDPSSALSVRLIGDYGKIDETCCAVFNLRASDSTLAITAPPPLGLGGQVNDASNPFGDVVYNNFPSSNRIRNYGASGQIDYDFGGATMTSLTSYRHSDARTDQDSDFTSADLIGRNAQDLHIGTFTQEVRFNADIGDRIKALLGAFYFNERIRQTNELVPGSQFRPYADLLIRGQSGNSFNLSDVEQLLGALSGNPAKFDGTFFAQGLGTSEAYRLNNEAISVFGQMDFQIAEGLTLTGGLSFTHDRKRFSTNVVSYDQFSALNLADFVEPAASFFVSQIIGGAVGAPGGLATPAQVAAFAGANPAFFNLIQAGSASTAQQLLALRGLQFLPPALNVPNAVEPGRISDDNLSYTLSLAYDASETVKVYARYATGYKAASVNLSRDARPSPATLALANAQGIATPNLTSGSRLADPESSTLYEAGLKAQWRLASANFAIFKQEIKDFQSNIFTGTGFFLANAGKQSAVGFEFEGAVRPVDPLSLTLAVTYLDSRYDSFILSAFGDLAGMRPAGFSPLSATFGGNYEHALGNGDRLIVHADYHYEAPFQLVEGLPGLVVIDPITSAVIDVAPALAAAREFEVDVNDVNASITYAMQNGLELTVWGRNLLDDRSLQNMFDTPAQPDSVSGYPDQPRTYGVSARFRF